MAADDKPSDVNNPFVGKWTYRSWINDTDPVAVDPPEKKAEKTAKLLLFEAELVLEAAPAGEIQGKLNTGAYGTLTVFGSVGYSSPFSIRIQAVGEDKGSPSEGWIYDYIGWLIPAWPNGVDQRPSIVGSVIRTVLTATANIRRAWLPRLSPSKRTNSTDDQTSSMKAKKAIHGMGGQFALARLFTRYGNWRG